MQRIRLIKPYVRRMPCGIRVVRPHVKRVNYGPRPRITIRRK